MKNINLFMLSILLFIGIGVLQAETLATDAAITTLNIVANSKSSYKIVYENNDATAKNNATELQKAIAAKTGVTLPLVTDATSASSYEIILGPYNARPEHTAFRDQVKNKYAYYIGQTSNKLVITASDNNHMACALKRFETAILKSTTLAGSGTNTGTLTFNSNNDQYAEFLHTQATLASIVANGYGHTLSLSSTIFTQTQHTSANGDTYVSQGACNDGTYFYTVQRDAKDEYSRLYKHKMSDGSQVKYSGKFAGHHSNDLTYDHKNKRLVLVHGSGATKKLSFFNPNTLALIDSKTIGRGVGALAYCKERDMYAASQGGNCLFFMNAALSYSATYDYDRNSTTEKSSNHTAQGMGCDKDYVYFPMNRSGYNCILVAYDWNGKYQKTLTIQDSNKEIESISECNGKYYANFHISGKGTYMYQINITLKYTSGI